MNLVIQTRLIIKKGMNTELQRLKREKQAKEDNLGKKSVKEAKMRSMQTGWGKYK